jgi:hypothetical protein
MAVPRAASQRVRSVALPYFSLDFMPASPKKFSCNHLVVIRYGKVGRKVPFQKIICSLATENQAGFALT